MPYIRPSTRDKFADGLPRLAPQNPGELNYLFSSLVAAYLDLVGWNYQSFNDVIGALDGAKMEFYRRHVAPYEDRKIAENGDVYQLKAR